MRALAGVFFLSLVCACGTHSFPGQPAAGDEPVQPSRVLDFDVLYAKNCAGCHGLQGRGGASVELGDPLYLAFADDTVLRRVTAAGVPGTSMPAFAQSAGGTLTEAQLEVLVKGMRNRWGKQGALSGTAPPPYAASSPGDSGRGGPVYDVFCARCHGPGGRGGALGSSIVEPTYLALVSEQHLRTSVLVGRADLGAPDWRSDVPGRPMSPEEVSDVVAWLSSHRVAYPGQPYPPGRASAGALP
ncbi:MAG: c-type cytochrome [Myxococcaceae bacterium]